MRPTGIERDFGGEIRRFNLSPIGAWKAVEASCGLGLGRVWAKLSTVIAHSPSGKLTLDEIARIDCSILEIREPIFQGLKGAGMPDAEASKLMRTAFDETDGKLQFASLSFEIVTAFWLGVPEQGNGEAPQNESEATTAPAASTSAPSTEQVLRSGSRRGKSTK